MLKRRSRSVGGKERFPMSDSNSPQSPSASNNLRKLTASSHLLFRSFSSKRFADIEAAVSPTSILETRPFSSSSSIISNSDRQTKKPPFDAVEPIGLGIVDALDGEKTRKNSERSMLIFGSQLRVQIPSNGGSVELLTSPIEFGVKNKESHLASCHACKRILGEGIDIYMYRGEKSFCSIECRHREILIDEGVFQNPSPDLSSSNGGRIRMW